jgi:AcrR family transcriptional regulator
VPKLWTDTIEEHRREVRDAVIDATAQLVAEHGLLSVTMSRIAEETGIGRATLYKYFPDVEAILTAWHERQITSHLAQLAEVRDRASEPAERLYAVLETFALISHQTRKDHDDAELVSMLHRGAHLDHASRQLRSLFTSLLSEAAASGAVRDDTPPDELADYCIHSLSAAATLPSKASVRRLVTVTVAGLGAQTTPQ